jgi:hypothetical protein
VEVQYAQQAVAVVFATALGSQADPARLGRRF